MGLRMGAINAKNGGAIVGEEKASKGALGTPLEKRLLIEPDGW